MTPNPPFSSSPVATLLLIHEPRRLSTFVEFNADVVHFGPHKKKRLEGDQLFIIIIKNQVHGKRLMESDQLAPFHKLQPAAVCPQNVLDAYIAATADYTGPELLVSLTEP